MIASSPSIAAQADKTWFGHPPQLARLFSTEMWERFGYYGMRALLTLYLAKHFLFRDEVVNPLYGAFTSLAYLTPFFGGLVADHYLGHKKTVKLGAVMMSLGYFMLCFGGTPATNYLQYHGVKYTVGTTTAGEKQSQYINLNGAHLAFTAHTDGSLALTGTDGTALPAVMPRDSFKIDGTRNPFYVNLTFFALAVLIVGNGFFKPNISTMVGQIYGKDDPRRDAGFTIFYMGINLGSLISIILCPIVAQYFGWPAGFALAAIGMALAWGLIQFDNTLLDSIGDLQTGATERSLLVYIAAILAVPLTWFLITNAMTTAESMADAVKTHVGFLGWFASQPLLGKMLLLLFTGVVIGVPAYAALNGSKLEFHMMVVAIVLCVFNVVFWSLTEQAGSSFTLFAERNTQLYVLGFQVPAGAVQSFNAIFIVLLAPLFSVVWVRLAKRGLEPSTPVKFAISLVLLGMSFLVLYYSSFFANSDFRVPMFWLALSYLIGAIAELCISPVGLSMITRLSMVRLVGMMMGVWFLSTAMGQYGAALISGLTSTQSVGGEALNPELSLHTYVTVYKQFGWYTIYCGIALFALSPLLRRWMHGVH